MRARTTAISASNRVDRGGSFNNDASNLRAGNRNNDTPSNANNNLGLRCSSSRTCLRTVSMDAVRVPKVCDQPPSSGAVGSGGRRRSPAPRRPRAWRCGRRCCEVLTRI